MAFPWQKMMGKIGNRAGSAVGAATGAVQLLKARGLKKAAEENTPSDVDPMQGAFLAELNQKRNALNSGAQYSSSIDAINDKMMSTQGALSTNTGGDVGGTVAAMLKAQQAANQGVGQLLAQGQQGEQFNNGMYGDFLDKVVGRRMELGLLRRGQNMAEWAQKSQTGAANLMAGAQSFMDFGGGDKAATNPIAGKNASSAPVATTETETIETEQAPAASEPAPSTEDGSAESSNGMGGISGMLGKFKGGGGGGFDMSSITSMFG
jgi:hypothetical protein